MDFILLFGWILLGTVVFGLVHKAFNITYFSFSGMFSVWFGCMASVAIGFYFAASFVMYIVSLVVAFVTGYYKWIIGTVVTLIILGMLGNKSDKRIDGTEETVGKEK